MTKKSHQRSGFSWAETFLTRTPVKTYDIVFRFYSYKDFHKALCDGGGSEFPESFTQNLHRIIARMKEASKKDGFEAVNAAFESDVSPLRDWSHLNSMDEFGDD